MPVLAIVADRGSSYFVKESDEIKLEMFSLPPFPIGTKLDIIREDYSVKTFDYNGSAIYKANSEQK